MPNPKKQKPSQSALWLRKATDAPRATVYQPGKTKQVLVGYDFKARVLADKLNTEIFHINVTQVISKYIGETEKNLKTIFKDAENKGAVLVFDEADALFGRRTGVRDAHDRYAMQSAHLFKRLIKNYEGTVIIGLKPCNGK